MKELIVLLTILMTLSLFGQARASFNQAQVDAFDIPMSTLGLELSYRIVVEGWIFNTTYRATYHHSYTDGHYAGLTRILLENGKEVQVRTNKILYIGK